MKITGFGVANFRSFGTTGSMIHDFGRVNVFIGKNNCGKSNVLRFLQFVSGSTRDPNRPANAALDRHRQLADTPRLGISLLLDDAIPPEVLSKHFGCESPVIEIWIEYPRAATAGKNPLEPLPDEWLIRLHDSLTNSRYMGRPQRQQALADTSQALMNYAKAEFEQLVANLIYVPAIREIRTEEDHDGQRTKQGLMDLSGRNLIAMLRRMQHPVFGNESEQKAFYRIQALIRDLLDVPDLLVEIPWEQDDIYLTIYGNRLPLASFGTGVHELVIICSTLALHENRVVCIEEPEIHLHPGLLRKFLRFLNTTTNTYFIATHSNVLLDSDEIASVYHVQHDGQCSRVTRSLTTEQSRSVLRDLGYRASDLLQTNGIIWVEGPSDRIYINRWLELSDSKFIEGIRYSIMFYGGACLANLSVTEGAPTEDFIELLRVNSHVVVVIDRDGDSAAEKLKEYKQRILTEAGANKCWITAGREIENYLTPTLLQRYLKSRYQDRVGTLEFHPDDRLDDCIKSAVDGPSFTYSSDKKGYARQICMMMSTEDLDSLDLRSWLKKVHDAIAAWNQG